MSPVLWRYLVINPSCLMVGDIFHVPSNRFFVLTSVVVTVVPAVERNRVCSLSIASNIVN
jgi:hypothetical protein